jgi:hypothetical protein
VTHQQQYALREDGAIAGLDAVIDDAADHCGE